MTRNLDSKVQITEELLAEKRKASLEARKEEEETKRKLYGKRNLLAAEGLISLVAGGFIGWNLGGGSGEEALMGSFIGAAAFSTGILTIVTPIYLAFKSKYEKIIKKQQEIQEEYQELQDALLLRKQNPEITTYR